MSRISQTLIDETVQEIERNQAAAEQQWQKDRATKVGADPSRPWHRVLNPERPPEQTFGDYLREQEEEKERKREQRRGGQTRYLAKLNRMTLPELEAFLHQRDASLSVPLVVAMLRNRTWKSCTGFASHLFKPSYWGRAVGHVLEREGLLQPGEFRSLFSDRRGRAGVCAKRELLSEARN